MVAELDIPLERMGIPRPKGMLSRREEVPKEEEATPEITMLPPRDKRLFSGNMAKKVITTSGIKWQVFLYPCA
jgi:hypothetical protein